MPFQLGQNCPYLGLLDHSASPKVGVHHEALKQNKGILSFL
jgi:hypothetical protein